MKAKLFFTAILLCSFFESTFSQDYHPLLNNSTWVLRDYVSCCRMPETKTIEAGEDVVIGANTYKKFIDPFSYPSNSDYIVYLREDVDERKVYKLVNGSEVLLYDFNLFTGDTFGMFDVTSDYININGEDHKRIVLSRYQEEHHINLTQTWIEGVGSNAHPFKPAFNMYNGLSGSGGYSVHLVCSFQDGQHIYGNQDCAELLLNTDDNVISNSVITFFPNPLVNELTISSDTFLTNAAFKLYNMQGQLVREIDNLSGNKISVNRENLSSGMYFIQLFENNKLIKSDKMLVE
ncbi:T9SS type A sorting domain-containing protein [Flavobacterium sp.]|uniref:T9SS type A sorting domain-containing protein n=1 Tax=Flavobacterium sp. TaxID=239 RepID=UPI00286AEC87|nr:T9SS type A sorting domain-containing protein [Flavobacterium sp.]